MGRERLREPSGWSPGQYAIIETGIAPAPWEEHETTVLQSHCGQGPNFKPFPWGILADTEEHSPPTKVILLDLAESTLPSVGM